MTPNAFRKFALSLPEATEGSHMGHPDFRVRGKIFATLGPNEDRGMVKLPPDEQADLVDEDEGVYVPAKGAWGLNGCTIVRLRDADAKVVQKAMVAAWRRAAPKRLALEYEPK